MVLVALVAPALAVLVALVARAFAVGFAFMFAPNRGCIVG